MQPRLRVVSSASGPGRWVAIRSLGAFSVQRHDGPVASGEWQSKKARDLVKILITRRGHAVTRESLIETLWPMQDPCRTSNRLSVALSTARSVLDPGHRFAPDRFIRADRYTVRLDLVHLDIDVEVFLAAAGDGLRLRRAGLVEQAVARLEIADAAYTGDFLEEDLYEDWAVAFREEARADFLAVARVLAELADGRGDDQTAIGYRLRILTHDPYDERAHLRIVAAHEAAGRHGEARRTHGRYQERMAEIGVRPRPFAAALASAGSP